MFSKKISVNVGVFEKISVNIGAFEKISVNVVGIFEKTSVNVGVLEKIKKAGRKFMAQDSRLNDSGLNLAFRKIWVDRGF